MISGKMNVDVTYLNDYLLEISLLIFVFSFTGSKKNLINVKPIWTSFLIYDDGGGAFFLKI